MRKWYTIEAKAGDTAEVWIYEQIGEDWFGDGIAAKEFVQELAALKVANIDLHVNSPGGSVFDGQAIYNALVRHPATVTSYVDGIAASIASVIALAGDRVVMAANALFMIHDPAGLAMGTAEDMRKMADVLDKVRDTIVGVYESKTGKSADELAALMTAETWLSADEAVESGFADEVGTELALAASLESFDLSRFKHAPTNAGKRNSAADEELLTEARDNIDTVLGNIAPEPADPTEPDASTEVIVAAGPGPVDVTSDEGPGPDTIESVFMPGVGTYHKEV